jgi:hypothetical protein
MGYSCSAIASTVLDVIGEDRRFDISHFSYRFFFEIGRENRDGAITGFVYSVGMIIDTLQRCCKRKGSFRIEPNGEITRFPGLPKSEWKEIVAEGLCRYRKENESWKVV